MQVLAGDPLKGEPFSLAGRVARVGRLLAPVSPPDILCIGLNYLGCNSIDIWNLRLDLGRKLRCGLRTRLGMHFLAVD